MIEIFSKTALWVRNLATCKSTGTKGGTISLGEVYRRFNKTKLNTTFDSYTLPGRL